MAYTVNRLIGSLCLLASLAACANAPGTQYLSIPSNPISTAPELRLSPRPLTGKLEVPTGPGPHPVVIVMHACSAIGADGNHEEEWASRLNEWGYAALILDSLGPRSLGSTCSTVTASSLSYLDRAGDAINAALALEQIPGIDGRRIGVIGFSYGGSSAVMATSRVFDAFRTGLIKAAVDYYGRCPEPENHGNAPLLVLVGSEDLRSAVCADFRQKLRPGQAIEMHIYPGAYQEFDNPRFITSVATREGGYLQYNYTVAIQSFGVTHAFLDHYVRDAK